MIGLGNLLIGDEGVGVHVITRLAAVLGDEDGVTLIDGGTLGLGLLAAIEEASHLVVVDALRSGRSPGEVSVLTGPSAVQWEAAALSAHDLGLPSVLGVARLRGWQPVAVTVVGVEPASFEPGVELSSTVAPSVAVAVEQVLRLLRDWGLPLRHHTAARGVRQPSPRTDPA